MAKKYSTYYRYVKNLKEDVKDSIRSYTDEAIYEEINWSLQNNKKLDTELKNIKQDIDAAFDGAPPLEEPLTVYRGLREELVGDILKSYISTSLDYRIALDFTQEDDECCIYEILIPKGVQVLFIENISMSPNEKEVLLPRCGKINIITKAKIISSTSTYDVNTITNMRTYGCVFVPKTAIQLTSNVTVMNPKKIEKLEEKVLIRKVLDAVDEKELDNKYDYDYKTYLQILLKNIGPTVSDTLQSIKKILLRDLKRLYPEE